MGGEETDPWGNITPHKCLELLLILCCPCLPHHQTKMVCSILMAVCHFLVPPLDKRIASSIAPLNFFISSSTILVAAYIRLRLPALALQWRLLIFSLITLFVIHSNFSRYTRIPWQSDEELGIYVITDIIAGGGVFGIITMVLDFLILAREDDFDVIGANEYRKYLTDKYPDKDQGELHRLEKQLCQGETFERPRFYPGTKNPYVRDIAEAARGLGYKKGLDQKSLTENQGGYFALMKMEKLQESGPKVAKAFRQKIIMETLKTLGFCFLVLEVTQEILSNGRLINLPAIHQMAGFDEAVQNSILPKHLAKYVVTFVFGCSVVARLQMFSAFCYLFALLITKPVEIPITIGRWEPLLFQKPHLSISMKDMWGKHWHGLIRRQVTVCFMRPCKQFAKKFGFSQTVAQIVGVLLSFIYSGLMHEMCMEAILPHVAMLKKYQGMSESSLRSLGFGWGADQYASTRFFFNCGLIVVVEEIWRTIVEPKLALVLIGKEKCLINGRIRKVMGWCWCMFWMTLFGAELTQTWSHHGMFAAAHDSIFSFSLKAIVRLFS